jgi:hypothetical protein
MIRVHVARMRPAWPFPPSIPLVHLSLHGARFARAFGHHLPMIRVRAAFDLHDLSLLPCHWYTPVCTEHDSHARLVIISRWNLEHDKDNIGSFASSPYASSGPSGTDGAGAQPAPGPAALVKSLNCNCKTDASDPAAHILVVDILVMWTVSWPERGGAFRGNSAMMRSWTRKAYVTPPAVQWDESPCDVRCAPGLASRVILCIPHLVSGSSCCNHCAPSHITKLSSGMHGGLPSYCASLGRQASGAAVALGRSARVGRGLKAI